MFIITFKMEKEKVDEKIDLLTINEIYNVYYQSPLDITTDKWGYGYKEKENVIVNLNVAFDGDKKDLKNYIKTVCDILCNYDYEINEISNIYEETNFPAIHIDENWVLASPNEEFEGKNKINFLSQGAFGTGLHETTQDILKFILNENFNNLSVLDLGTGSGILSLSTAIKGANKITAVDIRDVEEEVLFNASLNNINNINVLVGNILNNEIVINDSYDWIFINIGGEETKLFMDFIHNHLKNNGKLLISGLVEWSLEEVVNYVKNFGYKLQLKIQSNEWCT
ncbi:50S ribosomal protein L11 methyltransferase, partial [Clostridium tarantellae]